MANTRLSTFSTASGVIPPQHHHLYQRTQTMQSGSAANTSKQMSTTTLLNTLHSTYGTSEPYELEASTSLVVNTWVTGNSTGPDGRFGGTVDGDLARKVWEHARRRAEDACVVLGSLHQSTPSLFAPFISSLPLSVPGAFYSALHALRPFWHCVTPLNPSFPRHISLSAVFSLTLAGDLTGASISLSTSGIDTQLGLLNVPSEPGYRAFDVFYYLLTSASSQQEREYLGLKEPSRYTLLRRSETYNAPHYVPTADDAAAAEDWRETLKVIGIKGVALRQMLSVIAAILRLGDASGFLLDDEEIEAVCDDAGGLLDIDFEVLKKLASEGRERLIGALYEALVDWVIMKSNQAIRAELSPSRTAASSTSDLGANTPPSSHENADNVNITVIEIPGQVLGKAAALRTVFDDRAGINAEMKEDGIVVPSAGPSVMNVMKDAVSESEIHLDIMTGALGRKREVELDKRLEVLEIVGTEAEPDSFVKQLLYPAGAGSIVLGKFGRFSLSQVLGSSRVWFQLCLHPTDDPPSTFPGDREHSLSKWSAASVSSQIRSWRLPEWANHRNRQLDFTADFDHDEFVTRYGPLGCQPGREGIEAWVLERAWSQGEVVVGHERVWMREPAWWQAEGMLDMKRSDDLVQDPAMTGAMDYSAQTPMLGNPFYSSHYSENASRENLLHGNSPGNLGARSIAPTQARSANAGDYGLGPKGDTKYQEVSYEGELDAELLEGKETHVERTTMGRRIWVWASWVATFWMPSPVLKHVLRKKRPDVRQAWREKILLMIIIFLVNAIVVFYIIWFGRLLCPKFDKAWSVKEVGYHQGDNDFYVSHMGKVYDLTHFWKVDHSDSSIPATKEYMQPFGGTDVTEYIVPPLYIACDGLTTDRISMQSNNTLLYPNAVHRSGHFEQPDQKSALRNPRWYYQTFLPKMNQMYKGDLVYKRSEVIKAGQNNNRMWFIYHNGIIDLTDYFYTLKLENNLPYYKFLPTAMTDLVEANPGSDLSKKFDELLATRNSTYTKSLKCMNERFYVGKIDFRKSAKCQVNNYILLAFTIVLCATIAIKFLAALQLGSKKRPAQQDKFVICQVPAYTEGEDSLRKGLDSLTALAYDNKRKLICVICDGMIVGGGNDRPTPKIVLDVLGVDPKVDPPALPFKSVGQGAEQLNYGKVYSGLYEFEGNVVPYIVIVKVGKESEQHKSKPGNRGKRDSQILLMSFLNRVHFRAPMNPLELEIFHQINNIIGVDPELYEYLFMVDADTKVKEDSLNRLVAACANDSKIVGICGETSLENEERSWWTMIQVYEYYISHHLAKAFESLFGSVTCLPGCFCMYRLRTADRGRPLIISDDVIRDYSDIYVDTLHKKNLLSLGEDRYLTTLMTKYFPHMSYKFIPDAYALTEAPAEWGVLLSQRRRWINSTIHNLAELVFLKDLCGFCCFSMRFVVFIDLFGTIILPATCAYMGYLIYKVASHSGQFPLISIIMIAAVYGLQAIIFLVKRQWQHIGWMIIYILAYPIYSVVLPVYSFWKQDDFSWGNTRIVLGEDGAKKVVAEEENSKFDPRSIPLQTWDNYAMANNLPGRRGGTAMEKEPGLYQDGGYEMDDMQSVYSSVRPASTILTGFPQTQVYRPPLQSPNPFANPMNNRQSTFSRYSEYPTAEMPLMPGDPTYQQHTRTQSQDNLGMAGLRSSQMYNARSRSSLGLGMLQGATSRPASSANLAGFQTQGPSNEAIAQAIRETLTEVDMEAVTKKQVKVLVEQKLQVQITSAAKKQFMDEQIDAELANM
ncbi:glycosyltransferase family 2 protein [Piedraia hortae CBS 480.64]|uniref:chitin synthase n=1 Tax=Piedraia hortae CBS 480.64 TaxID=1314780 RepID=A0A6A7C297_9PEZI|nr:glycosyltransferase family 2 protein [Piedraia hortae CBS 480.64]